MAVCLKHPDKQAATKCVNCFKPMCAECTVRHGRLTFCSTECIEGHKAETGQGNPIVQRERQLQKKKFLVRFAIVVGIALAAVGIGVFLFTRNG